MREVTWGTAGPQKGEGLQRSLEKSQESEARARRLPGTPEEPARDREGAEWGSAPRPRKARFQEWWPQSRMLLVAVRLGHPRRPPPFSPDPLPACQEVL